MRGKGILHPLKTHKHESMAWDSRTFVTSLTILTRLREGSLLLIYLSVTDQVMSSVLIHKTHKAEMIVYFISKVFKYTKTCYQKIVKLAMSIIIVGRKLQPYFSGSQNPRKNQLPYLTSPKKTRYGRKNGILGSGTLGM